MTWWGTREKISLRLEAEFRLMRQAFGDTFKLIVSPDTEVLYWLGNVEINLTGIPEKTHALKILYPPEYPYQAAQAWIVRPLIISKKFQFKDGRLSLFNPKDGVDYGWNPAQSTAVTIAGWAIQWLFGYYTYRVLGKWPEIPDAN